MSGVERRMKYTGHAVQIKAGQKGPAVGSPKVIDLRDSMAAVAARTARMRQHGRSSERIPRWEFPELGRDTRDVQRGVAGYSEEQIAALAADEVLE